MTNCFYIKLYKSGHIRFCNIKSIFQLSYNAYSEGGREIRPCTMHHAPITGSLRFLFRTTRIFSESLNLVPNPAIFSQHFFYLFYQFILSLNNFTKLSHRDAIQEMLISCPQNFK